MGGRVDRIIMGLALLVLSCATSLRAQKAAAPDARNWMLAVSLRPNEPDYLEISQGGVEATAGFSDLHWEPDSDKTRHAMLELVYRMEGGAVRVRVSVRFDAVNAAPPPAPEMPVGTYVVRQNESVTLSELSLFGLSPVQLKLVSAKPPDSTVPPIVNQTSSLVVESVDEDRASYKVVLRNTSPSAAEGLVVTVLGADGTTDVHDLGPMMPPFICSGETHELAVSKEGNPANPQQLVIEAVVFEDGTHEGDGLNAAILEGKWVGRKTQEQRISDLVENQLRTTNTGDTSSIESLRSQDSALSDEPEPKLVKSVMTRFPVLADSAEESVRLGVKDGLRLGTGIFLNNLTQYVYAMSHESSPRVSLEQWWSATRGRQCSCTGTSC